MVVVVVEGLSRPLGHAVAGGLVGHMAPSDLSVLMPEVTIESRQARLQCLDRGIEALDKPLLHGVDDEVRVDGLGG